MLYVIWRNLLLLFDIIWLTFTQIVVCHCSFFILTPV